MVEAATPPPSVQITVHRVRENITGVMGVFDEAVRNVSGTYESYIASALVDPSTRKYLEGGRECGLLPGSWVQCELPVPMLVSHFRLAFGRCSCERFQDWTFEAYDSEQGAWRQLFSCDRSPWPAWAGSARPPAPMRPPDRTFPVSYVGTPFPSARFRILLEELLEDDIRGRCMHINSLELFGTVLPGWNLD